MFEGKELTDKVNAAADRALHDGTITPNEKGSGDDIVHSEKLASERV